MAGRNLLFAASRIAPGAIVDEEIFTKTEACYNRVAAASISAMIEEDNDADNVSNPAVCKVSP